MVEVKGQHPDSTLDAQITQAVDSQLVTRLKKDQQTNDVTADLDGDYQTAISQTERQNRPVGASRQTAARTSRAQICTLNGFSAHAGQKDLLSWLGKVAPSKPAVVLTHGEDGPRKTLAGEVRNRFGVKASMPGMCEVLEF